MGQSTPERPVMRGKKAPAIGSDPKIRAEKPKIGEPY